MNPYLMHPDLAEIIARDHRATAMANAERHRLTRQRRATARATTAGRNAAGTTSRGA